MHACLTQRWGDMSQFGIAGCHAAPSLHFATPRLAAKAIQYVSSAPAAYIVELASLESAFQADSKTSLLRTAPVTRSLASPSR